jgi:8-oxo-dGTP pyrophosphatase MutT (NUDIX family)
MADGHLPLDILLTMDRVLVASIYVVRDAKVLLVRHKELDRWLAPGGHLLPGETPHECAVREAREETGVTAEVISVGLTGRRYDQAGVVMLPTPLAVQLEDIRDGLQHIDLVYAGRTSQIDLVPLEAEVSDARWAGLAEMEVLGVPDNVVDVAEQAIGLVTGLVAREAVFGIDVGLDPTRRQR